MISKKRISPYRGRILVIESDLLCVQKISTELREEGYQVEWADQTNRCFDKIKNEQVDVVILAVEVWENKGYQLIPVIRRLNNLIPIIVTSTDDSIEAAERVREHDIFFYAIKPLDMEELKLVIKNALLRRQASSYEAYSAQRAPDRQGNFEENVLDLKQASKLLKMSQEKVSTLAREGEIPAGRIGNKWHFIRNQLLEWLRITAAGNQKNYGTMILETMEEGVAVIDSDLKIVSCNSAYLRTLDVPRERIIGEHCYAVSHRSNIPCAEANCPVRQAFKKRHPVKCMHVNYDNEGNERYCDIIALPMRNQKGKVLQVVEIIRDNSEIYNLNKHLDWITSFLALESRKTLGSVVMNISALFDINLSKSIPNTDCREMLLSSLCSVKALQDMIRNYIITYKAENGQLQCLKQECDVIRQVIEPTLREFKPVLGKKNMSVAVEVGQRRQLLCDPYLLKIALCNLLSNAVKYGTDSTIVECRFRIKHKKFELKVFNEGVGVPQHQITNIFNRFARFDEWGTSGSGLGLHVVKKIAEIHEGTVQVESGYIIRGKPIKYNEFSAEKQQSTASDPQLKKFATFTLVGKIAGNSGKK